MLSQVKSVVFENGNEVYFHLFRFQNVSRSFSDVIT